MYTANLNWRVHEHQGCRDLWHSKESRPVVKPIHGTFGRGFASMEWHRWKSCSVDQVQGFTAQVLWRTFLSGPFEVGSASTGWLTAFNMPRSWLLGSWSELVLLKSPTKIWIFYIWRWMDLALMALRGRSSISRSQAETEPKEFYQIETCLGTSKE